MHRTKQLKFFKETKKFYGGSLMTTRKGREGARPLDTKNSMHIVLRSSKAKGAWAFTNHRREVKNILQKFCGKYGIKLIDFANVGNHLHLHIKLGNRQTYRPFIRAITAAIMMSVTGVNRWSKTSAKLIENKFWDFRPYSRVVMSWRATLNLRDYFAFNRIEAMGFNEFNSRMALTDPKWANLAFAGD